MTPKHTGEVWSYEPCKLLGDAGYFEIMDEHFRTQGFALGEDNAKSICDSHNASLESGCIGELVEKVERLLTLYPPEEQPIDVPGSTARMMQDERILAWNLVKQALAPFQEGK